MMAVLSYAPAASSALGGAAGSAAAGAGACYT